MKKVLDGCYNLNIIIGSFIPAVGIIINVIVKRIIDEKNNRIKKF